MNLVLIFFTLLYIQPCGRLGGEVLIDLAKIIEQETNDYKIVYQAVLQATRPVGHIVQNLLSFEILSSTEWHYSSPFQPNFFVDISSHIYKNLEAMSCFDTEQPKPPHPRSDNVIKSLATFRGSQSAEAFEIIRIFSYHACQYVTRLAFNMKCQTESELIQLIPKRGLCSL